MNSKKLLSLYSLKWNPFSADLPTQALIRSPRFEHFAWRVENLAMEGGFALITGDSGLGKSVALRSLADQLAKMREVTVAVLQRPQSGLPDFYRELGALFGIELRASNRWGGYRMLREKWQNHIDSHLLRPVLLIDEAQEMMTPVLSEMRLLSSSQFDSQRLLTVVLAGDHRLTARLKAEDLIPLGTRIRARLNLETASKTDLVAFLKEGCARAGNPSLMTDTLIEILCDHSAGNPRILMSLAAEILALALKKEAPLIDESLYLEAFPTTQRQMPRKNASLSR